MADVIDARGFQLVPNAAPAADAIGSLVSQRIAERLGKQAMAGDQAAYGELASRDPRAAVAIGSILQNQQEQQAAQQKQLQEQRKQKGELAYRVARGYQTASDKRGYLASAAQSLAQAGHADLAQGIADDVAAYDADPAAIEARYAQGVQSLGALYGEKPQEISPLDQAKLQIDRDKAALDSKRLDAELGMKRENLDLERAKLGEMRANNAAELDIKQQKLKIDQQEADIKKAAASGSKGATEDERKAAGWLAQAQNSFVNMEKVLAQDPSSDSPGAIESLPGVATGLKNYSMSEARQKYTQAASSFAEAALRAATGAGVTKDEAEQKITELTPKWGDSQAVKDQKRASLKVYLGSLKDRAGRAAPDGPAVPVVPSGGAAGGIKFLGFE